MRVELCVAAPPFTVYAPGSCDFNIGKAMNVFTPAGPQTGVITAAEVTDDGAAVYTVTIIEIRIGAPRA